MKVSIQHQEVYSRKELLLRTFFGIFYIAIPHFLGIIVYSFWVAILQFYAFFAVLFTEKYPRVAFDAYVGLQRWSLRVSASLMNMVDGYPPFGPSTRWEKADFDLGYPSVVTRKRILFAAFLGAYAVIPQMIVLYLRLLLSFIYLIINFFTVLFKHTISKSNFDFIVGTERLSMRVSAYTAGLYFKYPEFTGEETEIDRKHA